MRKIKFRAWDKTNKKMWQYPFGLYDVPFWIGDEISKSEKRGEIMQFTGLKDKNRKEVYEGDIVMINLKLISVISFKNGKFGYKDREYHFSLDEDIKILGNIYENPELLKELLKRGNHGKK